MGNQPTKPSGKPKKAVHWKSAEPPSPPGKPTIVPGTPNSSQPDVVTLRWKRPTSDGGSPILGYIVEHRRTGSPHWVRATAQLIQLTELSLTGLEPGWRYQFRVVAQNIVGQSDCSEVSDALTVTLQRAAVSPPRFVNELYDTTAIENEKIEFRVSVTGTPIPQISWYKDGFEIFSSRRTKIVSEADISILVIHQSALTDEGEIKCVATNRAGHAVTICNLMIEAYPKIRLPRQYEEGLIIEADEVIRLKVGIAGQPSPIVEWMHNGELLKNDGRREVDTTDKSSTLKISNAQRSDRGEYNLRAFNKLGDDYASFLVTVTSRPEPPGKISISLTPTKTVCLSWEAPEDDGGCKIGNYIVEYYRVGWDVWLKATTCRQLTTLLSGLFEGSQYRFRVKAENPYGVSEPSRESDTLFIPDPKRGINSATQVPEVGSRDDQLQPVSFPRKRRDESRSPARDVDQVKKAKAFTPDTYSRGEIVREMSYGARDEDMFKPIKQPSPQPPPSPQTLPSPPKEPSPKPIPAVIITEPALTEPSRPAPIPAPPAPVERPQAFTSPLKAMEKFSKDATPLTTMRTSSDNQLTPSDPQAMSSGPTSPSTPDKPTIHNSSEFMLVLYNDQEAKNNTRNSTFDFELDEMVAPPPPLSLSAPELNIEPPPAPTMRHAVSSTELLYERAMARFYQAVALEESENQRKEAERRRNSVVSETMQQQQLQIPSTQQSVPDPTSARLADRRSSLRRRLSGDKETIVKQSSFETDGKQHSSAVEEVIHEEVNEVVDTKRIEEDNSGFDKQETLDISMDEASPDTQQSEEFVEHNSQVEELLEDASKVEEVIEDHDDELSISSSMNSMIEELKRRESLRSRGSRNMMSDDEEMETYHPGQKLSSPYQNPDPSQAIEVLTKPLPLPDPNFVPKPILKRPSTEMLTKDEKDKKAIPNKPERKSLTNVFIRKSPTKETLQTQPQMEAEKEPEKTPEKIPEPEVAIPNKVPQVEKEEPPIEDAVPSVASQAARQRRLESRQNSIEESRAVADFYGEILDRVENSKKPRKLPLYMNSEEVRKLNERERSREASFDRIMRSRSGSRSPLQVDEIYRVPKSRSPSLTSEQIVIKGKPARESKILRQRSTSIDNDSGRPPSVVKEQHPPPSSFSPTTLTRPEHAFSPNGITPETARKSRPMRDPMGVTKKRNVSQTRSRSNSAARDAESIPDGRRARFQAGIKSPVAPPHQRIPLIQTPPEPPTAPVVTPTPTTPSVQSSPSPPQDQLTPEQRSRSQSRTREPTPQEASLKSTLSYLTDVALFGIACWLYLFKNPKWAIPVIILIMYRHISDALRNRIPPWMKRNNAD